MYNEKLQTIVRLRRPPIGTMTDSKPCHSFPFNSNRTVLPLLSLPLLLMLACEVVGPRLKMAQTLTKTLPSPPSTYSVQFVVFATVTTAAQHSAAQRRSISWQNNAVARRRFHRRPHRHSHRAAKERRRQNAPAEQNQTARLVAELLEELKQTTNKQQQQQQQRELEQYSTKLNLINATAIGTDLIAWQLFSQCSKAFVRIRVDDGKVDARGGTEQADEECQTLFSPELVAGERGARGLVRLVHVHSGRLLCLGRSRGLIARKRNSRTLRDPLCWLREGLTPSGYTSLSATRPVGFSRTGNPLTHSSRTSTWPGRCFQFTKLISRRRVQFQWQRRCPPISTMPTATARRTRAGDENALREMARRALLAKIEAAHGAEDGSGTEGDEPFTIPITL